MRTLHSWSKKIPALGIHVIKAYTEFQQYLCIIFEDMSILLSAIFIFHGLILLLVAETSEQHRYLVIIIIILNIGFMVLKTTGLNPVFQRKNPFWKIFTESWDIGKNVSGLFRDFCYKQQNQTSENEDGAQKNVHRVLRYWQKCIAVVQRFLLHD